MMLTWRDKDDSLHSIPLASATEVLKKFYADWPGGFAEIESALRTAANRAAKLDVSPNTKTTPCPTCSAPCTTKVLMRGGEHGWGTSDLERTRYSYAGAPKQVAGVERTFGYWQTHPEHEPLGDHSMVPLTVRLTSFPESNGKRNWTALLVRKEKWDGLIGNCGGITIERGELWNRVAYEAERARFLIGERDTEPFILDYGDDIKTPEEWKGEVHGGRKPRKVGA